MTWIIGPGWWVLPYMNFDGRCMLECGYCQEEIEISWPEMVRTQEQVIFEQLHSDLDGCKNRLYEKWVEKNVNV